MKKINQLILSLRGAERRGNLFILCKDGLLRLRLRVTKTKGIYVVLAALAVSACMTLLPKAQFTKNIRYLDQGWSAQDRSFYYKASQGTFTIPLSWIKALEQPGFGEQDLFTDPVFMSKLGFMYAGEYDEGKGKGLPIGFAVSDDPTSKQPFVGFSCAACHTGQLDYIDPSDKNVKAIRIDGGASMHSLDKFRDVLTASMIETHTKKDQFERFAKRVLGENYTPQQRENLRQAVKGAVEKGFKTGITEAIQDTYPVEEGYGRLDALQRISNTVFGYDLEEIHNLRLGNGPVSYPHVWDINRLDWVQWNGSVRQPMARNVGEALGVFAKLNLVDKDKMYDSTVPVRNLHKIEETLKKLKAPQWPEDIWALDMEKVALGKKLFKENCASCHGEKIIKGTDEWRVTMLSNKQIGTDSTTSDNFVNYRVDASKLGGSKSADQAFGLYFMTDKVMQNRYKAEGVTAKEKPLLDGNGRKNLVRTPCGYKARPLHGIWATAPFLHNGSVPNLYELLSPYAERSKTFDVGSYMFDPVKVGMVTNVANFTKFDVSLKGSSNSGHIFDDVKNMEGVIGRKLSEEEKYAIIEFLKSYKYGDIEPEIVARPTSYPCGDTNKTYGE
jgi:mono/diheme cytochrome c family protein